MEANGHEALSNRNVYLNQAATYWTKIKMITCTSVMIVVHYRVTMAMRSLFTVDFRDNNEKPVIPGYVSEV